MRYLMCARERRSVSYAPVFEARAMGPFFYGSMACLGFEGRARAGLRRQGVDVDAFDFVASGFETRQQAGDGVPEAGAVVQFV